MQGHLFPAVVEDAHQPRVPANPHGTSQILRRRRVISLGHFHMAVTIDLALGFVKVAERFQRQGYQRCAFHLLKDFAHLLLRGAVNPRVGDGRLPIRK